MSKKIMMVLLVAMSVMASAKEKDKVVPLSESAGAALKGKSVVVTRHDKASFTAMTAGKATFALLGAGAMIVAGNKIVADNNIADPADLFESELVPAVVKHYGLLLKEGPSPVIKASKPKEIAATQTDGDYILDVQSAGWMFAYYPTSWDTYWIGYVGRVQLIDRLLSATACSGCEKASREFIPGNNLNIHDRARGATPLPRGRKHSVRNRGCPTG